MIKVSGFDLCLVRYLEKGGEMPCVLRSRRFALIRMALWDEIGGFISGQILLLQNYCIDEELGGWSWSESR